MKTYEKYKNSRVAWLGKIPEHWEIAKLRKIFTERSTKVSDKDYPALSVGYMGVVPQLETAAKTDNGDNRKLICKGDFAINSRSDRKGAGGISEYTGSASMIITVIKPHKDINGKFYHYLLRSHYFSEEFYRNGRGLVSDLWTTNWNNMRNILVPVPPLAGQEAIVKFLDYKISRIEKLISIRQRQISELKELKKAIINKAVTKGLQDVPMKDSGVTWLGKIPEHWEEKFLEQVCREKLEKNVGNKENNVLSLSYGYIVRKRDIYSGLVAKDFADYQIVKQGDIILRFTDLQNDHKSLRTGLVKETGIITSAYVCIRPTINSAYLHYLLHTYDVKKVFYGMGAGVRQSINYKDVRHILVPVPPFSEQNEIAKYLDKKCTQIDKLITIREKQITELNELKARLISDAVTGKIDVR